MRKLTLQGEGLHAGEGSTNLEIKENSSFHGIGLGTIQLYRVLGSMVDLSGGNQQIKFCERESSLLGYNSTESGTLHNDIRLHLSTHANYLHPNVLSFPIAIRPYH